MSELIYETRVFLYNLDKDEQKKVYADAFYDLYGVKIDGSDYYSSEEWSRFLDANTNTVDEIKTVCKEVIVQYTGSFYCKLIDMNIDDARKLLEIVEQLLEYSENESIQTLTYDLDEFLENFEKLYEAFPIEPVCADRFSEKAWLECLRKELKNKEKIDLRRDRFNFFTLVEFIEVCEEHEFDASSEFTIDCFNRATIEVDKLAEKYNLHNEKRYSDPWYFEYDLLPRMKEFFEKQREDKR